jgi:UDP-glucose 4-epimerase
VRIANIPGRDAFINSVLRNHGVGFYGDKPYVRDYIHLDDLCRFIRASIDYINSGGQPCTLNAGSGLGYNFHQIVDEIERQLNTPITRNFLDAKSGDVLKIICDITSAKDRLGWLPEITELKDIIDYAVCNKTL